MKSLEQKASVNEKITNLIHKFKKQGNQVVQQTIVKETAKAEPMFEPTITETANQSVDTTIETKPTVELSDFDKQVIENKERNRDFTLQAANDLKRFQALQEARYPNNFKKVEAVKPTKTPVYLIAKHDYYLSYDNGRCLFSVADGRCVKNGSYPTVICKTKNGEMGCGPNTIKQHYTGDKTNPAPVQLTQFDFDNIIKGQPSKEQLFSAYDRYNQPYGCEVMFDLSKVQPIW